MLALYKRRASSSKTITRSSIVFHTSTHSVMKSFIIFSILLATVYGRSWSIPKPSRIYAGNNAADGDFPYSVALRVNGELACGGAILNNQWVLTAAHCIRDDLTVHAGSVSKSGGVAYPIEKAIAHDRHNPANYDNDLGLIKVQGSIEFNDVVKPISLPSEEVKDGQLVVLSGWGYTSSFSGASDNLKYLNLTALTVDTCPVEVTSSDFEIAKSQICTHGVETQGACFGDDGSPLVSNNEIVGIFSRYVVLPCANGNPDVYASVHYNLDWIKKTIESN